MKRSVTRIWGPTSSEDTIAPRVVYETPRIDLQKTCKNIFMPPIIKEKVKEQETPEFSNEEYNKNPLKKENL